MFAAGADVCAGLLTIGLALVSAVRTGPLFGAFGMFIGRGMLEPHDGPFDGVGSFIWLGVLLNYVSVLDHKLFVARPQQAD